MANKSRLYAQKEYQRIKIENLSYKLEAAQSRQKKTRIVEDIKRAKRKYVMIQKQIDEG